MTLTTAATATEERAEAPKISKTCHCDSCGRFVSFPGLRVAGSSGGYCDRWECLERAEAEVRAAKIGGK